MKIVHTVPAELEAAGTELDWGALIEVARQERLARSRLMIVQMKKQMLHPFEHVCFCLLVGGL